MIGNGAQVGGHHRVELLQGQFIHAAVLHAHAGGIVDQHVDPAVLLGHVGDQRVHGIGAGQVKGVEPRAAAGRFDLIDGLLAPFHIASGDDHLGGLRGAELGNANADSAGGTGDDDDLIFQSVHIGFSFCSKAFYINREDWPDWPSSH